MLEIKEEFKTAAKREQYDGRFACMEKNGRIVVGIFCDLEPYLQFIDADGDLSVFPTVDKYNINILQEQDVELYKEECALLRQIWKQKKDIKEVERRIDKLVEVKHNKEEICRKLSSQLSLLKQKKILVDADSCNRIQDIENLASQYNVPVILYCDVNHYQNTGNSKICYVMPEEDEADVHLIKSCNKGDIVIANDLYVLSSALDKGAVCIDFDGKIHSATTIDLALYNKENCVKKNTMRNKTKNEKADIFHNSLQEVLKK